MSKIIEALNWRYATKKFDADKKLNQQQIDTLIESVRLAPSSFGIDPYRMIEVNDPEIRQKLRDAAWNQTQVTEASNFFVFAVPTDLGAKEVEAFTALTAKTRGLPVESLKDYDSMIKGSVASRNSEQNMAWAARQAYIALGVLLTTAALENIDATPMEGFDPKQFDEILDLKKQNLTSVVSVALGFRSSEDKYANLTKVRFPTETLVIKK